MILVRAYLVSEGDVMTSRRAAQVPRTSYIDVVWAIDGHDARLFGIVGKLSTRTGELGRMIYEISGSLDGKKIYHVNDTYLTEQPSPHCSGREALLSSTRQFVA